MAKTIIKLRDGTTVTIEGPAEEVVNLASKFQITLPRQKTDLKKSSVGLRSQSSKNTPINLVSGLIDGGFFKKPKDLASVKVSLEEMGHYYPVTSLSPTLLRLVKKRCLRRIKQNRRWLYVG